MGDIRREKAFIVCGVLFFGALLGVGLLLNANREQEHVSAMELRERQDEMAANAIQRAMYAQRLPEASETTVTGD